VASAWSSTSIPGSGSISWRTAAIARSFAGWMRYPFTAWEMVASDTRWPRCREAADAHLVPQHRSVDQDAVGQGHGALRPGRVPRRSWSILGHGQRSASNSAPPSRHICCSVGARSTTCQPSSVQRHML
jgi:hypothetical protein